MIRVEIQYRIAVTSGDPEPWRDGPTLREDQVLAIDGLDVGETYDVRTRKVRDDGSASPWVTRLGILIERASEERALPTPIGLHVTDEGCLAWQLPDPALKIQGFEVRHAPPDEDEWLRHEPLHDGVAGAPPFSLCRLPGGQRSVLVAVRGEDGTLGEPTRLLVKTRDLDDVEEYTLRTVDEAALSWPGDRQGASLTGGVLVAALYPAAAPAAPWWPCGLEPAWSVDTSVPYWTADGAPPWVFMLGGANRPWARDETVDPWGIPRRWIEYVWSVKVDTCEALGPLRLTVSVDVTSPNGPWLLQYRRPGISSQAWDPNDYSDYWDDDAAAAWQTEAEPYEPWAGHLDGVPPGTHKFRLIVPGGRKQGSILSVVTTLSAPARREFHELVAVPIDGGRVKPDAPFRALREVRMQTWTGTPFGTRVDIEDKDRTRGPALIAVDPDGVTQAATVDVTLRGY